MGAPLGNRNAAGPRKTRMKTITRNWSSGTTKHTFKVKKSVSTGGRKFLKNTAKKTKPSPYKGRGRRYGDIVKKHQL